MSLRLKSVYMNENGTDRGWWGQNLALFIIAAVAIVLFVVWLSNKSGQDKADLAASIQRLYGKVDCIEPQVIKYIDRVDAIGVALAKTAQSQADFQEYIERYMPVGRCGSHGGCGTDKFTKETTYTAGTTTLVEKDVCRS